MIKRAIQVGAGGWGDSWLNFLDQAPDWELVGLASRGGSNLQNAQDKWSISEDRCFTDIERALDVDADVVIVTTPHHLHVDQIKKAVDAGKHVLCEKPLADSFSDAKEAVAYAKANDRILAVSQNFRYREGLWQLRAAAQGAAGPVNSLGIELVQHHWAQPEWRIKQSSPILMEIMIHHVDMTRFLLGFDARSVFCRAWNPPWAETEGTCVTTCVVEFENGANLSYSGSWAARGDVGTWEGAWRVQFENGSARWNGEDLTFEGHDDTALETPQAQDFPGMDRLGVLKDLAEAIDGTKTFPTDGEDNLKSLGIVFAALKSAKENRVVEMSEVL